MSIDTLKNKLSDLGYDFRGAPDNYDESMKCESCQHFKRPYPFGRSGKVHGHCSEIDLGVHNAFNINGELDVPSEYICGQYKPAAQKRTSQ